MSRNSDGSTLAPQKWWRVAGPRTTLGSGGARIPLPPGPSLTPSRGDRRFAHICNSDAASSLPLHFILYTLTPPSTIPPTLALPQTRFGFLYQPVYLTLPPLLLYSHHSCAEWWPSGLHSIVRDVRCVG